MMRKLSNIFTCILPAVVLLGLWQWYVSHDQRLLFLFASPEKIWEAALGLLGGTIFGTAVGLLLFWGNGRINFIMRPYLAFIGSIPIFALAPLTIMWFGIGLFSKVMMTGFAVFFISLLQAYEEAHAVAQRYLSFLQSIAAPNSLIVIKLLFPAPSTGLLPGIG